MNTLEKRKNKVKNNISKWFKDNNNKILFAVIIFAIIIKSYFFFQTLNQTVWWDESDYVVVGKIFAGYDFDYGINPRRPFLLPLIFAPIFMAGLEHTAVRFVMLLFSITGIWLTYLVGKELFNKKVGIIATFAMSVFWLNTFFTQRVLTTMPATTFLLASIYFFFKNNRDPKKKNIFLSGLFFGFAFFTRAATLMFFLLFFIYMFIEKKHKMFLQKKNYIWLIAVIIALSPFIIWLSLNFSNPVEKFLGIGEGRWDSGNSSSFLGNAPDFIKFFPTYLGNVWLIVFLIGFLYLVLNLVLGFDYLLKGKQEQNKLLFIFIWIVSPIFVYGYLTRQSYMEPRYLQYIFPAVFYILSDSLLKITKPLKKYEKSLPIIAILLILGLGAFYQLNHTAEITLGKSNSYKEVELAANWIEERSSPEDAIMTMSVPQTIYYSNRNAYTYSKNTNFTAEEMEEFAREKNAKYFTASVFEPHTPEWAFTYGQSPNRSAFPVQAYQQNNQPVLIIYQFNQTLLNSKR